MSLLGHEEQQLSAQGWGDQRIADLRHIVNEREDRGITRLRDEVIDARLRAVGIEPTDEVRSIVELVLYPAYRDAHLDAEIELPRNMENLRDETPSDARSESAPSHLPATLQPTPAQVAPRDVGMDG